MNNNPSKKLDVNADVLLADTLRILAIDAVQKANSGHPGLPLGAADVAAVLWNYFLKHNPADPKWPDRDRFILSAGHGSALLYALLHVWGYSLSLSDLQNFRQWGARTPGHPEYHLDIGIETTTGPLGQGLGNAVGLAIAERLLAAKFNRPGFSIFDHFTYVLASDGDLMEGISHEVASLAGHLGLGKLIVLFDNNGISIDGPVQLTNSDDAAMRFQAYGWQVLKCDGHNPISIFESLNQARQDLDRPTLLVCRTHIGYASPRQDTSKAHGEPLGEQALAETKAALDWQLEPAFYVPELVYHRVRDTLPDLALRQKQWQNLLDDYAVKYPQEYQIWKQYLAGDLPEGWEEVLDEISAQSPEATRAVSGKVLERIIFKVPTLVGGSADLSPSNNTFPKTLKAISRNDFKGIYIHYGIREHGMGAIMNGLALHGLRPYGGTFLVFSDYMRPAIRMAALMLLPVIYVFTHDSIGLGEDGPTHQPIEQLTSLRLIPDLVVIRPADNHETIEAWRVAIQRKDGPTALVLSRQALPQITPDHCLLERGAYILSDLSGAEPDLVLIGTGSELQLAVTVQTALFERGKVAQVVSMPSWELFDQQTQDYQDQVLPAGKPIFAIEAGTTLAWSRFTGDRRLNIGIDRFGASAPYKTLYKEFGLTPEHILEVIEQYFDDH